MSTLLNLKTIDRYLKNENLILIASKDKKGQIQLTCRKNNFLTYLIVKIFNPKNYRLSTIVKLIQEQQEKIQVSLNYNSQYLETFYRKLNEKIEKHNRKHSSHPLTFEKIQKIAYVLSNILPLNNSEVISQQEKEDYQIALDLQKSFENQEKQGESLQMGQDLKITLEMHNPETTASESIRQQKLNRIDHSHQDRIYPQNQERTTIETIRLEDQPNRINTPSINLPSQERISSQAQAEIHVGSRNSFEQEQEDLLKFLKPHLTKNEFSRILRLKPRQNSSDYQFSDFLNTLKDKKQLIENKKLNEKSAVEFQKETILKRMIHTVNDVTELKTLTYIINFEEINLTNAELNYIFGKIQRELVLLLSDEEKKQESASISYEAFLKESYQVRKEHFQNLREMIFNSIKNFLKKPIADVCKFLNEGNYYSISPILVMLLCDECRKNLQDILASGINKGIVSSQILRVLKIFVAELMEDEEGQFVKDFFEPYIYLRENNLTFSKLYKNPLWSDLKLKIGEETFFAHRVILRSFPALEEYADSTEREVNLEENEDLKMYLKWAYDQFEFGEFKDEFKSLEVLCKRSFLKIYNSPENSDFIIESSSGKKIYLHKAMIECSDLDYFRSLINNGMKEGLESKLTVEEDEFEILKVIFEYIYKNEMPEFADEVSKTAFEDALNYYRAKGELVE